MCVGRPSVEDDPACPELGERSSITLPPCTPEIENTRCGFLQPTGDPCMQPPVPVYYRCCQSIATTFSSCPEPVPDQDERCPLLVIAGSACTPDALSCSFMFAGGMTQRYVCCGSAWRTSSFC
jgi:hypothetical protein